MMSHENFGFDGMGYYMSGGGIMFFIFFLIVIGLVFSPYISFLLEINSNKNSSH